MSQKIILLTILSILSGSLACSSRGSKGRSRACGIENPQKNMKASSRVVGGYAAGQDQFPWMAFIWYRNKSKVRELGSGVIVAVKWVLTSGFLTHLTTEVDVYIGDIDLKINIVCPISDHAEI